MSTIIFSKTFDVTPHDLWDAISNKESLRKWYFNILNFDSEVGAKFDFYDPSNTYLHRCEVMINDRDH